MSLSIDRTWLIPLEPGQAVDRGWTAVSDHRPVAVTWHWTATWDLASCNQLLGGAQAARRGVASAHFAVGRSAAEGIAQYVELENRAWHAGKNQLLRHDGRPYTSAADKAARLTLGIETVNIGYARPGVPAGDDWIRAHSPDGQQALRIQPWSGEQLALMIALGKSLVARWPHIGPDDHHGHHDLCPTYKLDVVGFPFAEVLAGIYDQPGLVDIWSPYWQVAGRKEALLRLGYLATGDQPTLIDRDIWYRADDLALRRLQRDHGLVVDGLWTVWVSRKVHTLLGELGAG